MKYALLLLSLIFYACSSSDKQGGLDANKVKVIYDTDCNNELDDQHAQAYLLANGDAFYINGVTVNATRNGGDIEGHYKEAQRILKLFNSETEIPLLKGANGSFKEITSNWNPNNHDGRHAVDFMINQTKMHPNTILLAVGKLTNVALAIKKDPSIVKRAKVVWLGSNYPDPGEYNLINDTTSLNYVLESNIPFEMVVCRYGKPSGTDAVRATPEDIRTKMKGKGPTANNPIEGRNGGDFNNFGDYSINLFENIHLEGNPPSRALFDMVAAAIIKNPEWGETVEIPCPTYKNGEWIEQPDNDRKITIWENFDKKAVMKDFYESFDNYTLASKPPTP